MAQWDELKTTELFSLAESLSGEFLKRFTYPWEALPSIAEMIRAIGNTLPEDRYEKRGEDIWVARSAKVFESAYLSGPLIVGENAEVRHCAFIRGSVLIGDGATVGNSSELKNSILFNKAQVPHYNYVGDSILGTYAHMGAGSITSNLKSDHTNVTVRVNGERIETGLRKFGAMLGDHVEVGCGTVMNPGTVIGKNSMIYPVSCVRGFVPANSIFKKEDEIVTKIVTKDK